MSREVIFGKCLVSARTTLSLHTASIDPWIDGGLGKVVLAKWSLIRVFHFPARIGSQPNRRPSS